jgi:hypothetical protein
MNRCWWDSAIANYKTMRPIIFAACATSVAATLFLSPPVFAADEVCGACDKKVMVTGQISF